MRSSRQNILGFATAAAIAGAVVIVYLAPTERPPELTASEPKLQPRPDSEANISTIYPDPATTESQPENHLANESPPPVQNGELSALETPPRRHGTPIRFPEKAPYVPSTEELQRFNELKVKAYSPGMTLRHLLMLKEYGTLPEPMRQQLFQEVVMMAMRDELNRQEFLEELPRQ